jgi:hypothetical protein
MLWPVLRSNPPLLPNPGVPDFRVMGTGVAMDCEGGKPPPGFGSEVAKDLN